VVGEGESKRVREGVGKEGRNDPNIVCTYEYNKNLKKKKTKLNALLKKGEVSGLKSGRNLSGV
jgi:hypothetical protein